MSANTGESAPPKKGRGRPPVDKAAKTNLQFHLVMRQEEYELFGFAAKEEGMTVSAFLRNAIRTFNPSQSHSREVKKLLPALMPDASEVTNRELKKHAILLLNEQTRAIVDTNEPDMMGAFIRRAGITRAISGHRTPEIEEAIQKLLAVKG